MSTSNAQNPTKFPFVSCYWFIGIKYIASCSESIRPRIFLSKISNWNNLREQNRSTILSPFSLSLVLSRVKSNFSSNFLLENSKSWKKSKKRNKKKKECVTSACSFSVPGRRSLDFRSRKQRFRSTTSIVDIDCLLISSCLLQRLRTPLENRSLD